MWQKTFSWAAGLVWHYLGELGQALIVGCSTHFLLWCNSKCCYSFQPSPFHILNKNLPGSINRASTLNVHLTIDIPATLQNINPILGKQCFKLKLLNPNSMVSDMSNDISWVVCGVVWVRRWGLRRDLIEGGRGQNTSRLKCHQVVTRAGHGQDGTPDCVTSRNICFETFVT